MKREKSFAKYTAALTLLSLFISFSMPSGSVFAQTQRRNAKIIEVESSNSAAYIYRSYQELMHDFYNQKERITATSLNIFKEEESRRLTALNVSSHAIQKYFDRLDKMYYGKNFFGRVSDRFTNFFKKEKQEFKIAEKPAQFSFNQKPIIVKKLLQRKKQDKKRKNIFISRASAENENGLPLITDIQQDNEEIEITGEIEKLARDLNKNPVEILNFVQKIIRYEPYFGAKKGALGCLHEGVCNDADVNALTIALLRAAGIPTRYKKSIAIFSVEELKNLLGVDETNTIYAALAGNNIPVFTITETPTGKIDEVDLSKETHLAVEWIFTELFYEYDERGGNISNTLDLYKNPEITNTETLQNILLQYSKKQWIAIDPVMQPYQRTKNEIVQDTINFDTEKFYYDYLKKSLPIQTQNPEIAPIQAYQETLLQQTGKDIQNEQYQSKNINAPRDNEILPPNLPYALGSGITEDGQPIEPETWSTLSSTHRYEIKIAVKNAETQTEIFSQIFSGIKINNTPLELIYKGATEQDEQIINSYGGIHATPVELVKIVPVLQDGTENEKISQTPIKIGDQLILEFIYAQNGSILYSDQKFSTAGNQEGVFITLSKIQKDELLDNESDPKRNSKILLKGNAALAREYLKHLEKSQERIEKTLDYHYINSFSRAVVTQNRILNTVDGTPSTFDFKGLTIDAATYISDHSRHGNHKTHRKDARLLSGLDASHYEGQLFRDITVLEGISTVLGIQHAYANPQEYTVHIITKSNENVIDVLQLSDNTKQKMHESVADDYTIITPQKPITKGAFTGIVYIALAPNWTGTYAIGEQAEANGGFSTDAVVASWYENVNDGIKIVKKVFTLLKEEKYFVYEDMPTDTASVLCTLEEKEFNSIKSDSGWKEDYGFPCVKETKQYGLVSHIYILATNAAKFYAANKYSYWVKSETAKSTIFSKVSSPNEKKFKFNPIAGTYSYNTGYAVYYQPLEPISGTENGKAWKVEGKILEKLQEEHYDPQTYICISENTYCGKLNWVLNILGYPTENEKDTEPSFMGTKGYYQNFIGGQIYTKKPGSIPELNKTYYVPGQIELFYNDKAYCISINNKPKTCGTGGMFGFPINDPISNSNGDGLTQSFEEADLVWNLSNSKIEIQKQSTDGRRLQNKEFARNILEDEVITGKITDIEAFAKIADYITGKNNPLKNINNDDFVKDITMLLVGVEKINLTDFGFKAFLKKQFDIDFGPYDIGGFSDTGFKFFYKDSYYCTDPDLYCLSNQLHHAMAGFNMGYFKGKEKADKYSKEHEEPISPLGIDGKNIEDLLLGYTMAEFGEALKNNEKTNIEMGEWILENLADKNYKMMNISQDLIKAQGQYRKNFRVFEYEQNGNTIGKWSYAEDMKVETCSNGKLLYIQNYLYFYFKNAFISSTQAIWNNQKNKIIFLYGEILEKYKNISTLCTELDNLTDQYGISLNMSFDEMIKK